MSQSKKEPVEVRIVGILIPWPELLLLLVQIAIIQVVLVGLGFLGLKLFGVV